MAEGLSITSSLGAIATSGGGFAGIACEVPGGVRHEQPDPDHPWIGPGPTERAEIVDSARSVAVVGASSNPARASYFVSTYLVAQTDYRLYFVNPHETEILGRPAYPDLASLPEVPDIVDVFRRPSQIPSVADAAHAAGAPVLWIQLGIWDVPAARYAEGLGLRVVMDRCLKIEHARFHGGLHTYGFNTGVISARRLRQ